MGSPRTTTVAQSSSHSFALAKAAEHLQLSGSCTAQFLWKPSIASPLTAWPSSRTTTTPRFIHGCHYHRPYQRQSIILHWIIHHTKEIAQTWERVLCYSGGALNLKIASNICSTGTGIKRTAQPSSIIPPPIPRSPPTKWRIRTNDHFAPLSLSTSHCTLGAYLNPLAQFSAVSSSRWKRAQRQQR